MNWGHDVQPHTSDCTTTHGHVTLLHYNWTVIALRKELEGELKKMITYLFVKHEFVKTTNKKKLSWAGPNPVGLSLAGA